MQKVTAYPNGIFCWVDLSTSDFEGAKAFYSQLFGWEADDPPPDGPRYANFRLDGLTVAGMGELMPDQQAQGMPSHGPRTSNMTTPRPLPRGLPKPAAP